MRTPTTATARPAAAAAGLAGAARSRSAAPAPAGAPRPGRAPAGLQGGSRGRPAGRTNVNVVARGASYDQEQFIAESKEMRLKHLEEQAMYALKISCENFDHAVFPNAMIGACRAPPLRLRRACTRP